jgi:CRISPR system Cascade subunit CasB
MIETIEKTETVSSEAKTENRFIKYLENLSRRQDRAALANLRRGLGKKPGAAMEMYPYLGQFLPEQRSRRYDNAVFIVAALFAYYSDALKMSGNLGASMRRLAGESDSKSIEMRFVALLNAETDELPNYLRQIIGLLKSKGVAVNWEKLFKDIQYWEADKDINRKYESVQTRWARSFWGNSDDKTEENNQEKQNISGGEQQ